MNNDLDRVNDLLTVVLKNIRSPEKAQVKLDEAKEIFRNLSGISAGSFNTAKYLKVKERLNVVEKMVYRFS